MTVFVANTNILELDGLQSEIDQSFINNASVDVTLTDINNNVITGAGWPVWPVTLTYVSASDGVYRAFFEDTWPFDPTQSYIALIHADGGVDRVGRWQFKFKPQLRKVSG